MSGIGLSPLWWNTCERHPVWPKYWNGGRTCTSQGDRACRSAELGRRVAKRLPRLPRSPSRIAQNRSFGIEPLGVRSRRLLMVIAQEPTQSLPALNRLRLVADIRITREQQDVILALVIPLGMIMLAIRSAPAAGSARPTGSPWTSTPPSPTEPSAPHRHSSSDSGQAARAVQPDLTQ